MRVDEALGVLLRPTGTLARLVMPRLAIRRRRNLKGQWRWNLRLSEACSLMHDNEGLGHWSNGQGEVSAKYRRFSGLM